ncbi:spermatogenesis-associated protein 48-like [Anneissia japonica]|uniref:spermatogenesis-associated protein 48-like n=1 Tax=Anneissia japonica TaxID=1529436 RepID=UPI0014259C7B|nr:spermatogenesis-associated protein 48-like [Anneissia japonica]
MAAEVMLRQRTDGDLRLHLQPDTNAGGNIAQQIERNRLHRHMKFPKLRGKFDFDSFQDHKNVGFVKYNGDTLAPNRDSVSIIDPTSGFISASADIDRNTGVKDIPSMQAIDNPPNNVTPKTPQPLKSSEHRQRVPTGKWREDLTIKRSYTSPHLGAKSEGDLTRFRSEPGNWSGRKISDAWIRAKLGGWTSDRDPREIKKEQERIKRELSELTIKGQANVVDKAPDWKDKAAHRYCYTSSTQRAYEDVDWDSMLPPKVLPPASTIEPQADRVSHCFNENKRYSPASQNYQNLGRTWDRFQVRDGYHFVGPVEFCSPYRKVNQIPNYTGYLGTEGEQDNPRVFYIPQTVVRTVKPRYTETARRANIPGYTGCTYWKSNQPANSNVPLPPPQTTARIHRMLPNYHTGSAHRRTSRMSKMVTLVPPGNPFNQISREGRPLESYH